MITSATSTKPVRRWPRLVASGLSGLLALVAFLLVLGAHFPGIDYLGLFGSLALSLWPAWFVLIAIAAGALVLFYGRGKWRTAILALAILTLLGAAVVIFRVSAVAREHGVKVTAANAFGFSNSLASIPPDETVVYTRDLGEALTLLIYRPRGPAPAGGWPVYMHIHGGGWIEGSNKEQSSDMRWFADRGWLVISVGYSLSDQRRHLWSRVIEQVGCAMAWTEANIAARGGDPNRLALRGGSAGGNLALNAAYMANAGTLRSSCGGRIPQVRSVTPIYPGVDLVAIHGNTFALTGPDVRSMVTQYTGGSPRDFPERYAAVGSASHISPKAPPTLMYISENDHLVPLASMREFADRARRGGVAVETISVPYAEHGFELTGMGNEIVRQTSLRFINANDRR